MYLLLSKDFVVRRIGEKKQENNMLIILYDKEQIKDYIFPDKSSKVGEHNLSKTQTVEYS